MMTSVPIHLNGTPHAVPSGASLETVLRDAGLDADTSGIAVAVNDTVIPRAAWKAHRLQAGDRVEIVRAVQGG